jgi:hypothetical protein
MNLHSRVERTNLRGTVRAKQPLNTQPPLSNYGHKLFIRNHFKRATLLPIAALAAALGACRAAIPPWGGTLAEARANADSALAALEYRFSNVERDAKFGRARKLMGHYALVPSRLYRDTSLWSTRPDADSAVTLALQATWDGTRYLFASATAPGYPRRTGEQRHLLRLRRVQGNDYEWVTIVDHAVGSAGVDDVGRALGGLLAAFEGKAGGALLEDTRTTFPRSGRVLGRLIGFDSVRSTPWPDGATSLVMHLRFRPDSLRRVYPAFTAWVSKYVMPSTLRMLVEDRSGTPFIDLDLANGKVVVRLRARQGKLVALTGPTRPMPDSLRMRLDFSAKFRIWRVGFSDLVGDFTMSRDTHERAWHWQFRKDPEWNLPFAVESLIKSPLRRPFEGRGTEVHLSVRDDLGPQTMSIRRIRTVVNESAIMRWLGSLGAAAFGDFEGTSEIEENRFLASLFGAVRRDVADIR